MYLSFKNARGEEMPLVDNPYFTITDFDAMTQSDVSISSTTMSEMDGDLINTQSIVPRTVTITLRVNGGVNPEEAKRYIMGFIKPKQKGTLALNYRERDTTLTGVVQNVTMPRFTNGVAFQFSLYCSQPLWEDVDALIVAITDVLSLHHWAIVPKEEADIVMGEVLDSKTNYIMNNGDSAIGMTITIVAKGGRVVNPRIMRENSYEYFSIDVSMEENQELVISTIKGQKEVTLDNVNIIDKVTKGSTWLQLEVGRNDLTVIDDNDAEFMQVSVKARELYV